MEWNSLFKLNNEDFRKRHDQFSRGIYKKELYESIGGERLISELLSSDKSGICYVAPSGSGKTNLFCRLAETWSKDSIVFLTGLNFRIESETAIYDYICTHFLEVYETDIGNNMDEFTAFLTSEKRRCIIMIDGIDECKNISKMKDALHYAIVRFARGPLKLVMNCRSVVWDSIVNHTWLSTLNIITWKPEDERSLFRDPHYNVTIHNYFSKYMISGKISAKNRVMCRYPAIMRLFCESNRGAVLTESESLKYIDIFTKLISRMYSALSRELPGLSPKLIVSVFEGIVLEFWGKGTYSISKDELFTSMGNVLNPDGVKIYQLLIHLHVIKECKGIQGCNIIFVHQLVLEYLIASIISRQMLWASKTNETVSLDIITFIDEYSENQLQLPVMEFFLPLLELVGKHQSFISAVKKKSVDKKNSLMLCRAIAKMGQVDIEAWQVLRELERSGDSETRAHVASTVYLLNENIPGDQTFHCLVLIKNRDDAVIQRNFSSRLKYDSNFLMFIKQIQPYCTIPDVQSDLLGFVNRVCEYKSTVYRIPLLNLTDLICSFNAEEGFNILNKFAEYTKDDQTYLDLWVNIACKNASSLYIKLLKTYITVVRNDRLMWERIFKFCLLGGKKDPAATFKLIAQGFETMGNFNIIVSTLNFIGIYGYIDPETACNMILTAWKKSKFLLSEKQMELRAVIADTSLLCFKGNRKVFIKIIQELINGDDLLIKEKIAAGLKKMVKPVNIEAA